jgi:hypothetical protein
MTAAYLTMLCLTAEAQTFRVSGTVVDSETGMPLNRTRVVLSDEKSGEWSAITGATGRFSLDVPQGKYELMAAHRDWGDVYGEPIPGRPIGAAVITGPDCNTTDLLFRFRGPVAIHGKILDENGEPIPSASVEVFHRDVIRGRKRLRWVGRAESSDFGDYSYYGLPAGTYYLAAAGEPWYLSGLWGADSRLSDSGMPPVPYGLVFFPGVTEPHAASAVTLQPGMEFRADFTLHAAFGGNLIPRCMDWQECEVSTLHAIGAGLAEALVRPCDEGCFERIGRYVLRYTGQEAEARTRVDVQHGGMPVEISKPAPTAAGKVTFQNPADRPSHALYVNLENEDTGESTTAIVEPDGSFSWPIVTASRVRLFLSGADGVFVARQSVEGAAVKNGVIEIADGATVTVALVASDQTGAVQGLVSDGDQRYPRVLVVLAPSGGSNDPHRYFAIQAGSDGSFEFPHVPAGDYVLFAVNNPEFEYAEPGMVKPYLGAAKRVRVALHATAMETIGLSKPN